MSDFSSSDDEESKFREVCDPTLWKTATEGGVPDRNSSVQAANPEHHLNHSSDRQSFLLLEKVKASLAAANQTKTASPWMGCQGSTQQNGSRMVDARLGNVAAPSSLSPYLAKQLAIRLDRSVGYNSCQEDPLPVRQECDGINQQSFHLLKNVSLVHQDSESKGNTQRKRVKVPKRLSYYNSSDEEELKTQCSSVAVSPEWILAGGESCPRPHPKNVRYLEEYKVKEHRSDGSILAVPSSALDSTVTTKGLGKRKKKKAKECVSENGASFKNDKVYGFQNGGDTVNEHPDSNVKTQRKQARKRGKKKRSMENGEVNAS